METVFTAAASVIETEWWGLLLAAPIVLGLAFLANELARRERNKKR